uniref:Uncharacterized protein n=1 Tax=Nelumbo nucifera TaxID=4432 RepID=A0A822Y2R6_NELNU|nr:TPA_asm: hypothetical protein HUJ06_027000 [Nelumbo nucifera]
MGMDNLPLPVGGGVAPSRPLLDLNLPPVEVEVEEPALDLNVPPAEAPAPDQAPAPAQVFHGGAEQQPPTFRRASLLSEIISTRGFDNLKGKGVLDHLHDILVGERFSISTPKLEDLEAAIQALRSEN